MIKKVKKSEKIYDVDESGNLTQLSDTKYNKKGKIIWTQNLFPSGEVQTEHEFHYEEDSLSKEKSWNEFGEWTETIYEYDNNELVLRVTNYQDGTSEIFKRRLNAESEIVEIYDSEGNLYQKEIAEYDNRGNDVKRSFYLENELVEEHYYTYNSKDEMIEKQTKSKIEEEPEDEKNEVFQSNIEKIEYDNNGNIILEEIRTSNGIITFKAESKYDGELLVQEVINDFEGSLDVKISTYIYDQLGNIIKSRQTDKSENLNSEAIYLNNEYGDMVQLILVEKLTEYGSFPQKSITKYEIEYY